MKSFLDPRAAARLTAAVTVSAGLVGGIAATAEAAPAPRPERATVAHRHPLPPRARTLASAAATHRVSSATTVRATSTTAATSGSSSTSTNSATGSLALASTTTISTTGLSANAVKVLRAINAAFPQVTDIGGIRSGADAQDHATGHALDLMIPNYDTAAGKALGDQIAAFLKAHQAELGVHYVIWNQHIWNVQRDAEGWRAMADRGSVTANHMDHVHVSVY